MASRTRGCVSVSLPSRKGVYLRNPASQQRAEVALRLALQPLEPFLVDSTVVELMLNPDGRVWVEHLGCVPQQTALVMAPHEAESLLRTVAAEVGKELNAAKPDMLCRLPIFGARLQAVISPIVTAPIFAMRRPAERLIPYARYIEQGVLTERQGWLLRDAFLNHANVLVGGSTGSGKTTFAASLLSELSGSDERVFIIEDYPELQHCCRDLRHQVPMLIDPPNYTWRNAVINTMRLRPDRIVVAEIVDGAAVEVQKSWLTGHPGGLGTIHGDSSELMLERFSQLMEEVVAQAPRETVAATINICVHMRRDRSHPAGRVVTSIVRVRGYDRSTRRWIVEEM